MDLDLSVFLLSLKLIVKIVGKILNFSMLSTIFCIRSVVISTMYFSIYREILEEDVYV